MSAPALVPQADAERLFAAAKKAGFSPVRVKLSRDGLEMFFDAADMQTASEGEPIRLD